MKQRSRERGVEGIAPPEPAKSGFAGSRWTLRVLCLLVLLYIPVQWIVGRSPGSTSIFSWQRRELERQFLEADFALRQQLLSQCTQHGVHDFYFGDSDVLFPYLVNEVEATPGCYLHRETDVTPITPERKLTCSAEIVDEGLPDAWNPGQNLGPLEGKVVSVSAWESEGKQFGFQLLQTRGCVDVNKAAER